MKEEDKNVYKKVGRKYVPIGLRIGDRYFSDGIYIVRHQCTTNAGYLAQIYGICKIGDNVEADFTKLASMEEYADVVAKTINNNCSDKGMTTMNLSRKIVKALFDFNKEKKEKLLWG